MRSVTYSMRVSADGYIVGPDGEFAWTAPDKEVFRFEIAKSPDRRHFPVRAGTGHHPT